MSLRKRIMRGGTYLALRQGLGMAISLGGVLLLTRTIGPDKYGLYTAAYGMFWYLQIISQLGIEVYLVRGAENEEKLDVYHQGFTLLLLLGLSGVLFGFLGLPLLQAWVRLEGFGPVAQAMFLSLPVVLMVQVPQAKLERNLDYQRVAMIELANQLVYFLVALSLAFQGAGVWAPVAGWWVQQIQSLALLLWAARYRPRFHWNWKLIEQMLGYSLGFSASFWVWQARVLVNPLIVGRYAGAEAVGYVALAIRMVEVLGFVKTITWRISIAALGQIQEDRVRLRKAINEGMGLQLLAVGPLLVGLAWVLPWLLPLLFGPNWLPAIQVYPFIALGSLSNSLFAMHSSVLYVLKRNWEVTVFHLIYMVFFAGAAFILVPRLGLVGYGWAEVLALGNYGVIHIYVMRNIGSPDYRLAGLWCIAFGAALFVYQLGWWVALGLVVIALLPQTKQTILSYIKSLRVSEA